ncbi:hypothetical protein ACFSHP_18255 [Novosphingobium panipatense]
MAFDAFDEEMAAIDKLLTSAREQSFRRHDRCCESNANLRWEQVAFRIMCALILITNLWQLTQNAPQPEARTERFDAIHE